MGGDERACPVGGFAALHSGVENPLDHREPCDSSAEE